MRSRFTAALIVVVATGLAGAVEAAGQSPRQPSKPFSRLFAPTVTLPSFEPPRPRFPLPRPSPFDARRETGRPSVKCGMTLVPVNPAFDAAMRKPAPVTPVPSARIVPAPTCP